MKPTPISILLYGNDAQLLETRQWVLQSRGFKVIPLTRLSGIRAIPRSPEVKLVVLCHTLSPAEFEDAVNLTRTRWPSIKHLALVADSPKSPSGILGQLLHTMDGPGKLISSVERLVADASTGPAEAVQQPLSA